MTVRNDPHIAALIVELVESSPEAPRFDELEKLATQPVGAGRVRPLHTVKPTGNRGWIVGIAAAAVTLILVGGVVWLASRRAMRLISQSVMKLPEAGTIVS